MSKMQGYVEAIEQSVRERGWAYLPHFPDGERRLVTLAEELGDVYELDEPTLSDRFITTNPHPAASEWAPFDREGRIGWHNDFSTHEDRPVLSLSWIARADPKGSPYGDWCVASTEDVVRSMEGTVRGRYALSVLKRSLLPFAFDEGPVRWFELLAWTRTKACPRLRFYPRALKNGLRLAGLQCPEVSAAIDELERTAERLGRRLAAMQGALLVVNNWHSLHDRLVQTVSGGNLRRALLCFVAAPHARLA